jgi:hypothetical protein
MALRLGSVSADFEGVDLGDRRRNRRLVALAADWAQTPGVGLPRACRTGAALEAAYRLLSNRRVTPEDVLEPQLDATRKRATGKSAVLVIHDTTEFTFSGDTRAHLGRTNSGAPGFFAHVSLALSVDDLQPIGIMGCETYARHQPPVPKKDRRKHKHQARTTGKESDRWTAAVDAVEERCHDAAPLIHVVDREGDQYRLMSNVIARGSFFVVRARHDRKVVENGTIWKAIDDAEVVFEREVALSRRRPRHARAAHGPREGRVAKLGVSATPLELERARAPGNQGCPPTIAVNVVRVAELKPPKDEAPIEWVLVTNLPVQSAAEIAYVVDAYRARWTIEELFRAIKTGCGYEKLQLENEHSLRNALAVILPIASQMLLLRQLSRARPETPASTVLTETQLAVLQRNPWVKVPPNPTAREALLAIASIGGHIKNNGDPGWQVLYAGFRDLALLELGWRARSDQS